MGKLAMGGNRQLPDKVHQYFVSMKSIIKYLQTQFVVLVVQNENITALSPGEKNSVI